MKIAALGAEAVAITSFGSAETAVLYDEDKITQIVNGPCHVPIRAFIPSKVSASK
jgi:hypothetical protein